MKQHSRKIDWRKVAIVVAIAFFSSIGVYTVAINAYSVAVTVVDEISLHFSQKGEEKTVVEFSHYVRVMATHDCHILELIQKQGFFYQEALTLSEKAREDNNLPSSFVKEGTILWLPTKE